jgi:hypothetical protein
VIDKLSSLISDALPDPREEEGGRKERMRRHSERGGSPSRASGRFAATATPTTGAPMSNFKTYRVRYTEWQAFAIHLSARSAEEACELARNVRSSIGQEPFEEFDGAIENFEAEVIDARECVQGGAS